MDNKGFEANWTQCEGLLKKEVWFCLGGEGDATFLLKCHALCTIFLTSFVVHLCAQIYVVILNL